MRRRRYKGRLRRAVCAFGFLVRRVFARIRLSYYYYLLLPTTTYWLPAFLLHTKPRNYLPYTTLHCHTDAANFVYKICRKNQRDPCPWHRHASTRNTRRKRISCLQTLLARRLVCRKRGTRRGGLRMRRVRVRRRVLRGGGGYVGSFCFCRTLRVFGMRMEKGVHREQAAVVWGWC